MEFVKSDLNPALKYVKIDHWLVNVETIDFYYTLLAICNVNDVEILCNSKMAAAKPEILLYQRADELATKLQRLYPCFRRCPTQLYYIQCYRKLFSAENPGWRPPNRKYFCISVAMSYKRNSNSYTDVFWGGQLFYRRKLFSAANQRWRPENRNSYHFWWYTISQL